MIDIKFFFNFQSLSWEIKINFFLPDVLGSFQFHSCLLALTSPKTHRLERPTLWCYVSLFSFLPHTLYRDRNVTIQEEEDRRQSHSIPGHTSICLHELWWQHPIMDLLFHADLWLLSHFVWYDLEFPSYLYFAFLFTLAIKQQILCFRIFFFLNWQTGKSLSSSNLSKILFGDILLSVKATFQVEDMASVDTYMWQQ